MSKVWSWLCLLGWNSEKHVAIVYWNSRSATIVLGKSNLWKKGFECGKKQSVIIQMEHDSKSAKTELFHQRR